MKSILVVTDNPEFAELIQGCQTIEDNGFKVFIEHKTSLPLFIPKELGGQDFTWIILAFDNYDVYQSLKEHVTEWLDESNSAARKVIIKEPWSLIVDYIQLGFDVYSDWNNLILRNFFMK